MAGHYTDEYVENLLEVIQGLAAGMIESSIEALKYGDLDDPGSWVTSEDYWQNRNQEALAALKKIGMRPTEVKAFRKSIADNVKYNRTGEGGIQMIVLSPDNPNGISQLIDALGGLD